MTMGCRIRLLDCTLRDGGYVNDWDFGNGAMVSIFDRVNEAGVDIIEIGFLDQRQPVNRNRTIQPNTSGLNAAYSGTLEKMSMVVAMIDYGTCDIENVQPRNETEIDGIRIIFKKENMHNAVEFGKKIMDKGYKLFLNMVSITSYGDDDISEFIQAVNKICPFAVSIVDTYGLMHKEQMLHYFELLDKQLDPSISMGYHSHNNFQLAYSNTIEMLKMDTDRELIADGTLYGMGKSAGNAPLELLAMHLNENYGKSYDINQILEAINIDILPIYQKHYWGYGFKFYIAAKNDCHPAYVEYLMGKRTLSVKSINEILGMVSKEFKLKYDRSHIEELYIDYILKNIDDSFCVEELQRVFKGKNALLIGPGKSVLKECGRIEDHIKKNSPVTIAVNFIPSFTNVDYLFISNPRRYSLLSPYIDNVPGGIKTIGTSNITPTGMPFDYTLDYGKLVTEDDETWDNALIILLNLLRKIGVGHVALAGFDGFKEKAEMNYVDKSFDLSKDFSYLSTLNILLAKKLREYHKEMDLMFLTESMYDGR